MAIELRPLSDLDPDVVSAALAETVQRVSEDNPNLDVRRGVFAELLAYYHAVLDAQRRQNIADYEAARSLLQIEADPTLADPDLVDAVLSNFRLTRKPGAAAVGDVTVVVSDDVSVVIAQGSVWSARGKSFVAPTVYSAKLEEAQVIAAGDRLLVPTADGNWSFTIALVAAEEGPESNVRKDSMVVPEATPPNYVTSYAAADFTGGLLGETNADLVGRLQEGVAAKALSNRVNMAASLRAIDAFSRVVAVSIVGHGDAELVRAFHSVLPVALGGRCDWYVRAVEQVVRLRLVKSAVLVEKLPDGTGVWQFAVGRAEAPGFYEFADVRPALTSEATGGFEIVSDVRGLDLTGAGFRPDVLDPVEGAYTAFSTAVVRFHDTDTDAGPLEVGARADYELAAVYSPLVADVQARVSSRDVRHYGGDCLVKAPVPCFVSLSLVVYKAAGQADPDVAGMKDALAAAVNTVGFVGRLFGSTLLEVVGRFLLAGQTASAVDMLGRLRYPVGSTAYLRDSEKLVVPDDPANMVTARTVQFFAAPEDVSVSVVTAVPTDL